MREVLQDIFERGLRIPTRHPVLFDARVACLPPDVTGKGAARLGGMIPTGVTA